MARLTFASASWRTIFAVNRLLELRRMLCAVVSARACSFGLPRLALVKADFHCWIAGRLQFGNFNGVHGQPVFRRALEPVKLFDTALDGFDAGHEPPKFARVTFQRDGIDPGVRLNRGNKFADGGGGDFFDLVRPRLEFFDGLFPAVFDSRKG